MRDTSASPERIGRYRRGRVSEWLAAAALLARGYRILARRCRTPYGEIDIIAESEHVLVFIEVKTRVSTTFGEPEDAISNRKQEILRKTAEGFLMEHDIVDQDCRFDVIAIQYQKGRPIVNHIENAF